MSQRDVTNSEDEQPDEYGLTAVERQYLETPISQLNGDQRMTALAIKDKKTTAIRRLNEEFRSEQEAKNKKRKKAA